MDGSQYDHRLTSYLDLEEEGSQFTSKGKGRGRDGTWFGREAGQIDEYAQLILRWNVEKVRYERTWGL